MAVRDDGAALVQVQSCEYSAVMAAVASTLLHPRNEGASWALHPFVHDGAFYTRGALPFRAVFGRQP